MPEGSLDGGIEQLHYTWAPRGAEGINRFQIAGISAGLKRPPLISLMPSLRRLCRYDRPSGGAEEGPASFGWLDLKQHRVAFLRVPVPGVAGRSGSFAAHLLVGPADALPAGEVASSFGAGFWWTGLTGEELDAIAAGKRDFELPQLDWEEALGTRVAAGEDAVDAAGVLAHDLLSIGDGERLAVHDDGSGFGPALRTLGWGFPQALAGISLSTFEAAPVFKFTVVGTTGRPAKMRLCDLSEPEPDPARRAAARELFGAGPEADLLQATLKRRPGPVAGAAVAGSQWDLAVTLVALAAGAAVDPGPVAALSNPEAITYLAHTGPGRERLAEFATAGSPQPLVALAAARKRIPPAQLDDLCRAFGRRYAASGDLRRCADVLAAFPAGPARSQLEEEMLGVALRSEPESGAVAAEDALALLRIAAARRLAVASCEPLLRAAAPHIGACAADRTIPESMLAAMLPLALDERGAEEELSRALRRYPSLLIANLSGADEERRWLIVGRRLSSRQLEEALPALLAGLIRQPRRELAAFLGRLPSRTGCRALAAAGDLFERGAVPPSLATLCEEWAATALSNDELELARRLLAHGNSSDAQIGADLLADLRATTAAAVEVGSRAWEIGDSTLRTAIFEAALDAAFANLRHPSDARLVWSLIASSYPGADDETILERLLRRATQAPLESGQAVLLAWLAASLLPTRDDLRRRDGRPKSGTAADLSTTLARRASSLEIERLEPFVTSADRAARRWWKSLVNEHRKAHEPRRR